MHEHFLKCGECGTLTDFTALRKSRWICPGCSALIGQRPTQNQITYARSLGIERPEEMDESAHRTRLQRVLRTNPGFSAEIAQKPVFPKLTIPFVRWIISPAHERGRNRRPSAKRVE